MRDEPQEHPDWFDQRATITVIVLAVGIGILDFLFGRDVTDFQIRPWLVRREPWRLATCALVHGGPMHLAMNVMVMSSFGRVLEPTLGLGRTALAYLLFAFGSMGAEYAFWGSNPVGLSGVVYGQVGVLWGLGRWHPRMLGLLPQAVTRFAVGWFLLCIALTATGLLNVANVAHGVGALLGVLLGWVLSRPPATRLRYEGLVPGVVLVIVLLALFGRSVVNLSGRVGDDGKDLQALEELQEDRDAEALALLEEAVVEDPRNQRAWHNLGVARSRLGEWEGAFEAFERAVRIDPDYELSRGALQASLHELVERALAADDLDRALALTEQALLFDPADADAFVYRGQAYEKAGDRRQALEELRKARNIGLANFSSLDDWIAQLERELGE